MNKIVFHVFEGNRKTRINLLQSIQQDNPLAQVQNVFLREDITLKLGISLAVKNILTF